MLLQAALGLTSCFDWVESRVPSLNPHGPLSAQMLWSVSRQVPRKGCVGMIGLLPVHSLMLVVGTCLLLQEGSLSPADFLLWEGSML